MEQPESIEKYENLRDLARDFEYAAQLYARLIVSEVCLPVESKSIKPSSVIRGAAGGMKFICCGSILFKFALDVQLEGVLSFLLFLGFDMKIFRRSFYVWR